MKLNFFFSLYVSSTNTPPTLLPIVQKLKEAYALWYSFLNVLPKTHRYSLGQKIDDLFVDVISAVVTAAFLSPEEKLPYVRHAIRKMDTLKVLLMILWELKSLENKKYLALSVQIDEVGRMLGGWQGQLKKKTLPNNELMEEK